MTPTPLMKAAVIHSFEGIEKIAFEEVPIPFPKENEVQVAIEYGGINPVDWKICDGLLKTRMEYRFPIILGWDMAGTVTAVGKNVQKWKEGDAVFGYCRKEILHDGSFAEFICLNEHHIAKKPKHLSFAQAASIPLSALTAWQSLFDTVHLKAQETILIHAGAGGVGGFAIQLAKQISAYVITTASASNHAYVKGLGADLIIDYTKENFLDVIHSTARTADGVDVVYDTVGGKTLQESYSAVRKEGRLVTIAGSVDYALADKHTIQAYYLFVTPNGEQLQQIADLIDQKKLYSPSIQEIPFTELSSALRKSRERHVQGKMVLGIKN